MTASSTKKRTTRQHGGHRLFFALWPQDDVRAALVHAVAATASLRGAGRVVPAAKLHLTLHFLGGWPDDAAMPLDAVRDAAGQVDCSVFHLVVDRAGGFRGSRVGWLAPAGNSGLDALWSDLGRALDDAGLAGVEHERFSPHITVRRNVSRAVDEAPVDPVSWPVDAFVLVHSHDGQYDVVDRWPLRSGTDGADGR